MSKTYYCVSDIHSFATELKQALNDSRFDITNPDHFLVVLGDVFDRGSETCEVFEYLTSIPKSRLFLIKGNHEQLYLELLGKAFPESHDFSNGTVRTFCSIAGYDEKCLIRRPALDPREPYRYWEQIVEVVRNHKITKWIKSKKWLNYLEIGPYILVHSFIPTKLGEKYSYFNSWPSYYWNDDWKAYDPNWRTASDYAWDAATWGCPWKQYREGLFWPEEEKGKILVCGHWHSYDFRTNLDKIPFDSENPDYSIYISPHLIALDACTVVSHRVNVFKIEK